MTTAPVPLAEQPEYYIRIKQARADSQGIVAPYYSPDVTLLLRLLDEARGERECAMAVVEAARLPSSAVNPCDAVGRLTAALAAFDERWAKEKGLI